MKQKIQVGLECGLYSAWYYLSYNGEEIYLTKGEIQFIDDILSYISGGEVWLTFTNDGSTLKVGHDKTWFIKFPSGFMGWEKVDLSLKDLKRLRKDIRAVLK
jgi:hypothetical protein